MKNYDSWKTTDPRDAQEPDVERDPDDYIAQAFHDLGFWKQIAKDRGVTIDMHEKRLAAFRDMLDALNEVHDYLDNRADVDDGIPNEAMRLLTQVQAAIRKAEGR